MKTIKELASEALEVQDASNLSGVAQSFTRVLSDLRRLGCYGDTLNLHPITILWVDKLASLAKCQNLRSVAVDNAYVCVRMMVNNDRCDCFFGDPHELICSTCGLPVPVQK